MNYTTSQVGRKAQVKSNGLTKASRLFKKSRFQNLRGGKGPVEPIPANSAAVNITSHLSMSNVDTRGHRKISREEFEAEPDEQEREREGQSQGKENDTRTHDNTPDNTNDRATTPALPTPQDDTQMLQEHTRQLAQSRQKPFSVAKESTQASVVSRLFTPVVEFVEAKLHEMGRVVDGPVDVGHVLQHSGARQLNQATRQRGHLQALGVSHTLLSLPSSVPVSSADAIASTALSHGVAASQPVAFKLQLSQSPLVQNLVTSYRRAAANKDRNTCAHILSTLAESFTRQQLNEWVFSGSADHPDAIIISRHTFKTARSNSLGFGAGNVAPNVKHIRRRIKDDKFGGTDTLSYQHCVDFLSLFHVHQSYGTSLSHLSSGKVIELARVERTTDTDTIRRLYYESCTDCVIRSAGGSDVNIEPVPAAHLETILDALSGGAENSNQAALDSVYCKFGLQNFDLFHRFISIITVGRPELCSTLSGACKRISLFLRKEYCNHIFDESECVNHSKSRAFSDGSDGDGEDVSGGTGTSEASVCEECEQINRFLLDLEAAVDTAILNPHEESKDELHCYLRDTLVRNLDIYVGHLLRKSHEVALDQRVIDSLDKDTDCVVVIDYKMKVLSLVWRESMAHFYGKRGISLLGVAIVRYKTAAEVQQQHDAEEQRDRRSSNQLFFSETITEFYDLATDDATEDGWASSHGLFAVLKEYKSKNPHIKNAVVLSDGAATFSGTEFFCMLAQLGALTGIYIIMHIVKEAGTGKSFLDAHFAYLMQLLLKLVADGRGNNDIKCASDLVRVLTMGKGIANSVAIHGVLKNRPSKKSVAVSTSSTNAEAESSVNLNAEGVNNNDEDEEGEGDGDEFSDEYSQFRRLKGLEKYHQRCYSYDATGNCTDVQLSRLPLYSDVADKILPYSEILSCCPNKTTFTVAEMTSCITAHFHRAQYANGDSSHTHSHSHIGPQLAQTTVDRAARSEAALSRKSAAADRYQAQIARYDTQHRISLSHSTLHHCTKEGCNFFSNTVSGLTRHMNNQDEDAHFCSTAHAKYGNAFMSTLRYTDTDALKLYCQHKTAQVAPTSSKATILDATRVERLITAEEYNALYPAYSNRVSLSGAQLWHVGGGHRKKAKQVRKTAAACAFTVFVKGRGEADVDGGNKSLPSECVKAMFLHGTVEGSTIFCETDTDRNFMAHNNPPARSFKLHQLLSEDQLKAELRKPYSALVKSAKTVAAREAEQLAQSVDPLRRAIFKSQTVTLKRKWSVLVERYSQRGDLDQAIAGMLLQDTENILLADRRLLLLDFLNETGRSVQDVQLFL